MEDRKYIRGLLEALLFLSSSPIKLSALAKSCGIEKTDAREILDELILDYEEKEGGFVLREIAGGYQFITSQLYSEALSHIFKDKKRETLSRGTLDTLAILAYKQPITLTELDEIRGVSSRAMVASLISKKLVKAVGQKEVPGRPTLYGTTNDFLIHFGLSKLADLPTPVEVKELNFEELSSESIDIIETESEMNPDFDKDSLPAELREDVQGSVEISSDSVSHEVEEKI
ncbi:SMC-Scp complex subunit ScpB [Leptospira ognonensis]|uniref:SMC-Scp complex subunit ScpB n=1 Tax=Leptospira ognonensis TaxID=2484945 RepID=A0A4R9JXP0_9LEPT|nr:SMC-Scp complex subunit ScpB [Leptospira ognonensis]TGL57971.1 SMC-Scp complex subunit ScpB [Leptospira ognonensis]